MFSTAQTLVHSCFSQPGTLWISFSCLYSVHHWRKSAVSCTIDKFSSSLRFWPVFQKGRWASHKRMPCTSVPRWRNGEGTKELVVNKERMYKTQVPIDVSSIHNAVDTSYILSHLILTSQSERKVLHYLFRTFTRSFQIQSFTVPLL